MKLDGTKRQIMQNTLSAMHNGLMVLQREKESIGADIVNARYTDMRDDEEFRKLCENIERYEMAMKYIESIV